MNPGRIFTLRTEGPMKVEIQGSLKVSLLLEEVKKHVEDWQDS